MSACQQRTRTVGASPAHAPTEVELTSESLFEGENTVTILHAGERYLLRITRQNKLILTK